MYNACVFWCGGNARAGPHWMPGLSPRLQRVSNQLVCNTFQHFKGRTILSRSQVYIELEAVVEIEVVRSSECRSEGAVGVPELYGDDLRDLLFFEMVGRPMRRHKATHRQTPTYDCHSTSKPEVPIWFCI